MFALISCLDFLIWSQLQFIWWVSHAAQVKWIKQGFVLITSYKVIFLLCTQKLQWLSVIQYVEYQYYQYYL